MVRNSEIKPKITGYDISEIGVVYGLVGVIRVENVCFLLLILSLKQVASLPCSEVSANVFNLFISHKQFFQNVSLS